MDANHIGGVMISVLASSALDHGFESRSGQTKDSKIGLTISLWNDKNTASM
jgi:hypothetical protein